MQQIQFARKQKAKWNSPTHYSKGEPAKQPRNVCSSGQDGIIFARIDGFYALTSYSRGLEMENINVMQYTLMETRDNIDFDLLGLSRTFWQWHDLTDLL